MPWVPVSIVVPCYNEEGCLAELHRRLTAAARAAVGEGYEIVLINDGSRDRTGPARGQTGTRGAGPGGGEGYEIVLINAGSRDRTWPMMRELAAADPRLVAINLSRNHGHQLA